MKKLVKNKFELPILLLSLSTFLLVPISVFSGLITAPILLIISVAAGLTYFNKDNLLMFFQREKYKLLFIALLLDWALISILWSPEIKTSFVMWVKIITLIIFGGLLISTARLFPPKRAETLLYYLIFGVGLALILFLLQKFTNGFLYEEFYRLKGQIKFYKISEMNRASAFLAVIFWPCFAYLYIRARKYSYIFAVLVFIIIMSLESLSAKMAIIVSLLLFTFFQVTKSKAYQWFSAAIIIGSILFVLAVSMTSDKFILDAKNKLPHSAVHRLIIWKFSYEKFMEKPIAGWGFNSSPHIPGGERTVNIASAGALDEGWTYLPLHSHNIIMQTLLELGIVGAILLLAVIAAIISFIQQSSMILTIKSASLAMFSSYFTVALSGFGMWQHWWLAVMFISTFFMMLANQAVSKARAKAQKS